MRDSETYIVAVIDDDSRILQSLGLLLESAGYEARLYASGADLFAQDGNLVEIDCLISDIGMPVMDGLELRRVARASKPQLPIILITGRQDLAKAASQLSDCADGLFEKPFNSEDLLAAVAKAVGASSRD